jgi:hypothetical protein
MAGKSRKNTRNVYRPNYGLDRIVKNVLQPDKLSLNSFWIGRPLITDFVTPIREAAKAKGHDFLPEKIPGLVYLEYRAASRLLHEAGVSIKALPTDKSHEEYDIEDFPELMTLMSESATQNCDARISMLTVNKGTGAVCLRMATSGALDDARQDIMRLGGIIKSDWPAAIVGESTPFNSQGKYFAQEIGADLRDRDATLGKVALIQLPRF